MEQSAKGKTGLVTLACLSAGSELRSRLASVLYCIVLTDSAR